MACEARILRVLRTLGYPGLEKEDRSTATNTSLLNSPDECARIVSWIEDRKVRGRAIADRAPLRTSGPAWKEAFLSYLQDINCPYDLKSTTAGAQDEGREGIDPAVLRGLSWLVGKAVACEFEDKGNEYNAAGRQVTGDKNAPSLATLADRGGCGIWSLGFLRELDAACRTLGVERSSPPLPPVPFPSAISKNSTSSSCSDSEMDCDATVLRSLEAVLEKTKDGVFRDAAPPPSAMDVDEHEGVSDDLKGFAAGVKTGDEACDRVATVIRMLFLLDLRHLQDEVNGMLALAQANKP